MKYSHQREVIKTVVNKYRIHPTAEEVYSIVKQDLPHISLATVYRNLNLLVSIGEVRRLTMPDGTYRFDGDLSYHQHAVCENCGSIFDFSIEMPSFNELKDINFSINRLELTVNGICDKCKI